LQAAVDFLGAIRSTFPFKEIVTHRVNLDGVSDRLSLADSGQAIRVALLP